MCIRAANSVLLVLILFVFPISRLSAQLKVLDAETGQAIAGAFVKITDVSGVKLVEGATDTAGLLHYSSLAKSFRIEVRALSYRSLTDTLVQADKPIVYLQPAATSLEAVEIASRSLAATTLPHSTFDIQVFSSTRIAEKGAVNMGDLLNTELNARVINNGNDGSSLLLQGLSGQNVKILIDGVPQVLGMSNEFDLQQLNLSNVERVELVEGPLSVQFGTNALAGTLNIITKKADVNKRTAFGGGVYAESVGQYNGSAWVAAHRKSWNLVIDGSYNNFGGYASSIYRSRVNNPSNTVRGFNWSPKTLINGAVKIYRPWKGLNLGGQYNQSHQRIDNKGEQDAGTAYLTATDNLTIADRSNINLFANGKLGENTYLDVANSYGVYRLDNTQYLVNVGNNTRKVLDNPVDRFHTWTFRASYSEFEIGDKRANYQFGYDINLNNGSGESISDSAKSIHDVGVFGGMGMAFFNHLDARVSFRYIYNSRYDAKQIDFLHAGLPVVPSVSLKWHASEGFHLAASYTKAFRAPSFIELYREMINGSHYILGNPLLIPELADNYMFTGQWRRHLGFGNILFKASLYHNHITNKIELVQPDRASLPPQYQDIQVPRTYANIPLFKTKGINLSADYRHGERFSFRPGFGWLARSGSNSKGKFFHSYDINAQAMYELAKSKIRIVAFYKYNGSMAQFGIDESGNLIDQRLGSYQLLDLSATKSIAKVELTLGCKNLLGVTDVYQSGAGTGSGLVAGSGDFSAVPIAWGRTAFLKAAISF
ncbi:TonB-dependent siderophore receptor [Olivibacter sp. XZL3]|uniref:TonB-dependent receptor plug domain-containing protein n=1 Tax=Olivibacter sp. XZL3 TaxID=1735116 RepID=UPI0010667DE1|nr:TonB-dependent receptor [Olivibacter sp. XZL3]